MRFLEFEKDCGKRAAAGNKAQSKAVPPRVFLGLEEEEATTITNNDRKRCAVALRAP